MGSGLQALVAELPESFFQSFLRVSETFLMVGHKVPPSIPHHLILPSTFLRVFFFHSASCGGLFKRSGRVPEALLNFPEGFPEGSPLSFSQIS